jgi:hypothetical protein
MNSGWSLAACGRWWRVWREVRAVVQRVLGVCWVGVLLGLSGLRSLMIVSVWMGWPQSMLPVLGCQPEACVLLPGAQQR